MQHSYFANMGGFVVDVPKQWRYNEHNRFTISPGGVVHLTKLGFDLPEVTATAIEDRSKADAVTKLIACAQAAYMIIQIAARLATRLPITMLEVNTIAHVLCSFGMYFCWWYKPYNVNDPILVCGDLIEEKLPLWILLAYEMGEPFFLLKALSRLAESRGISGLPTEIKSSIFKDIIIPHISRCEEQVGTSRSYGVQDGCLVSQ
jgi:hypothetical protein